MVFPYIPHDLSALIELKCIHSLAQVKLYTQQMFCGLGYLHQNRILHRDLKCANLLVDLEGTLKVADFGLSREHDYRLKKCLTTLVVTRWYRPPELLLGSKTYNEAIDIWGAGCCLGEMLKGSAFFPGSSDLDQLECIFRICGTPLDKEWPEWRTLQHSDVVRKPLPRNLVENLRQMSLDASTIRLLDFILKLNPKQRPSAQKVLEDIWFTCDPLPQKKGSLPKMKECHEFDVRKDKK